MRRTKLKKTGSRGYSTHSKPEPKAWRLLTIPVGICHTGCRGKKNKGNWTVELHPDAMPKVKINATYAAMVKRADNINDNTLSS